MCVCIYNWETSSHSFRFSSPSMSMVRLDAENIQHRFFRQSCVIKQRKTGKQKTAIARKRGVNNLKRVCNAFCRWRCSIEQSQVSSWLQVFNRNLRFKRFCQLYCVGNVLWRFELLLTEAWGSTLSTFILVVVKTFCKQENKITSILLVKRQNSLTVLNVFYYKLKGNEPLTSRNLV